MLNLVPEGNCSGLHPGYLTPEHLFPAKYFKMRLSLCVSTKHHIKRIESSFLMKKKRLCRYTDD